MNEKLIADGKYVEVTYVLRENDARGEELEVCPLDDPFGFMVGKLEVLESFEQKLMGLKEGDAFDLRGAFFVFSIPTETIKVRLSLAFISCIST